MKKKDGRYIFRQPIRRRSRFDPSGQGRTLLSSSRWQDETQTLWPTLRLYEGSNEVRKDPQSRSLVKGTWSRKMSAKLCISLCEMYWAIFDCRRYTDLWLPLIIERGNRGCKDAIIGPLDVEWLSHTHRLVNISNCDNFTFCHWCCFKMSSERVMNTI